MGLVQDLFHEVAICHVCFVCPAETVLFTTQPSNCLLQICPCPCLEPFSILSIIVTARPIQKASQDLDPLSLEHVFRDPSIFPSDVLFIPPEDGCLSAQNGQIHIDQQLSILLSDFLLMASGKNRRSNPFRDLTAQTGLPDDSFRPFCTFLFVIAPPCVIDGIMEPDGELHL